MNWTSWLAGRLRHEVNELIDPSPREYVEFRNEPWHDEICLHREDWAWDFAANGESDEAAFNRVLVEALANDNPYQGHKL